ncbi:type VI secretion system baseplate subunit TssG [Nitrogeniibacter aestuarii]|uniref:type VI secretion system baseplate subunit TssG n=1 Tax=Nitrogeniibacter aestuarii TaxID=2815343 RepID=UPI001E46E65F|nr:type VI secretion system baseplate subunit TssG [Nitrogeniibacter aestuarii]
MRTAHRQFDPGLIDQIEQSPQQFEFFQAVRLLDRFFRAHGRGRGNDEGAVSDLIRFRNSLQLSFAPSQIEAALIEADTAAPESAHPSRSIRYVQITPAFMGMLGMHGTLPVHYTESVERRERFNRDRSARAFFDLFSNRAVGQFYRAWRKYRLAVQYETDRRNRFLPLILALGGLGFESLRDRLAASPGRIDDESIAHFAGLMRQRPVSAVALQSMLSQYFGVQVRIEQFVGRWYALPKEQRTTLGGRNACLGQTAMSGERVWQRNLRVRVHIGPLARETYESFLPQGEQACALEKLLSLATGSQFEYEVRPILRAADVRPTQLSSHGGVRLGFDAFMVTRDVHEDRADTVFELHAIH